MLDIKKTTLNAAFMGLIATVALVALSSIYAVPLADIDIWWHLATGRYLMQTGDFLSTDPFGLAGGQITTGRELILNAYWLSQVLFYGFHQLFGLSGIVALRIILLLIPPCAILLYGWRRAFSLPAVLFLTLICGWAMIDVSGIRPNHLTVAFVPLLFVLLAEIGYVAEGQNGGAYDLRKAWLLPIFMLLWANLHGGFLLGIVIVLLYAISETVTLRWYRQSLKQIAKLWVVVTTTILISLLTPNGISIFVQYLRFQGGTIQQKTSEYLSPLVLAQKGILVYWPYFIIFLISMLLLVVCRFRVPVTRLLLLLAMAAVSLTAFRYAPLFVGAAAILILPAFSQFLKTLQSRRVVFNVMNASLVCFLLLIAISRYPQTAGALSNGAVNSSRFPIAAVEFIKQKKLSGVVFNHFNWGGYLAWQQFGRLTTFIDGRSLSLPLFHAYTRVLWLPNEMQTILNRRGVDLVIMPRLNPFTGELYALTDFLWREKGWELVYRDRVGMVFVRQGQFPEVERLHKGLIYQDVLKDIDLIGQTHAGTIDLDKISGFARMRMGFDSQAIK